MNDQERMLIERVAGGARALLTISAVAADRANNAEVSRLAADVTRAQRELAMHIDRLAPEVLLPQATDEEHERVRARFEALEPREIDREFMRVILFDLTAVVRDLRHLDTDASDDQARRIVDEHLSPLNDLLRRARALGEELNVRVALVAEEKRGERRAR